MTPQELFDWRESLGLTHRAAAALLGMTLPTYQRLERGLDWRTDKPVRITRAVALACAAIRAGLPPEGTDSAA